MALTAAVIGCGNISKFHFVGLEKAGIKIKWVCDLCEKTARPWADKFSATFTNRYMDIVLDKGVDVVIVTCASGVHKEICLAAIKANKAVICEKTLSANADDSLEIVKLAQERQTIFYTSYMKRFIPAVEKAKELLPSLGRILSTHIRAYQQWGNLWENHPPEGVCHTPSNGTSQLVRNYGGGILVCGGSHALDLLLYFLGRPQKLYASMHIPEGRDYDLQAMALLETANGPVQYEALIHPLKKIGFLRDGWDERVEILGVNGRIEVFSAMWDAVDAKASLLVHYDNKNEVVTEYRYDPISPFTRAIEYFCQNIKEGKQGTQSRLTGYEVDELISHICKSAKQREAVNVGWRV